MKVLVTGANGYMGYGILPILLEMGFDIIATDLKIDKKFKNIKYIESDIFTIENPFDFYDQPDVLLHLAWRDGFVHSSNAHIDDLPKHYHFIESLIKSQIHKIVILGSMHEIGYHEGSINENTVTRPLSLYGIAKNCLREAVISLIEKSNTKLQWIRGYYIVSNSERGNSIFSKIIQSERDGRKKFPFTTGINQYDFLDYKDFCFQVSSVVKNDEVLGIINCCSGYPESLGSRIERFIKEHRLKISLDYGVYPDREYDSLAVWGDNTKIKKILQENNDQS